MAKTRAAQSSRRQKTVAPRSSPVALYDDIEAAWREERPELDLRMASVLLKMEHANHLHEARVQAISKTIGLNTGDLHVLLALRRSGKPFEARPTDLFRALLVTSGAITKRIARLLDEGLVLRVQANDDGRSELVRLTAKGLATADHAITHIAGVVNFVVVKSGLTAPEIALLDRCIHKLLSVPANIAPLPERRRQPRRRVS